MLKTRLLTAAAVMTLAIGGTAYAQSNQTDTNGANTPSTGNMTSGNASHHTGAAQSNTPDFQTGATSAGTMSSWDQANPTGTAGVNSSTNQTASTNTMGANSSTNQTASTNTMGANGSQSGVNANNYARVDANDDQSQTMQPTRSRQAANRMSSREANQITAELNRQQLQGTASTSLATTSSDTGLRTPDNSSVAAGSVASQSPQSATGDTVSPSDDSTMPQSQTRTPTLPNTGSYSMPDQGKTGSNTNPTDARDNPGVQ